MPERTLVESIPVVWERPATGSAGAPIALWLPWLGGTKEDVLPFLGELAEAGFVAVSFDPWQHGERGTESPEELRTRVYGQFRRLMWPILGQTTLECLRIIDWAVELGAAPEVVAGGVSMGGDITVALAGIDQRVRRVAAIVATPEWTRPGMRDAFDSTRLVPQGEADGYAQWFYDRLNPLSHLASYAHGPAITFECGAEDVHVPPADAVRFQAALADRAQVRVTQHPGLGHLDGVQAPALVDACLRWFRA